MKVIMILVLLLACISVQARLFETMNECEKRYGKHLSEEKMGVIIFREYKMKGVEIIIGFAKGKGKKEYQARSVLYTKPVKFGGFETSLVQTFLKANKGDFNWNKIDYVKLAMESEELESRRCIEESFKQDVWVSSDKKVMAINKMQEAWFQVCTKKFMKYIQKITKEEKESEF